MTKPDVLEGMAEVAICTGYRSGRGPEGVPGDPWVLAAAEPVYRTMPGWQDSVRKSRDRAALPSAFKDYVRAIEDLIETKVAII